MLTDNEIKKALECCCIIESCRGCRYDIGSATCIKNLMKDSADFINHQQAEIERLEIELKAMRGAANSYKLECERLRKRLDIAEKSSKRTDGGKRQ